MALSTRSFKKHCLSPEESTKAQYGEMIDEAAVEPVSETDLLVCLAYRPHLLLLSLHGRSYHCVDMLNDANYRPVYDFNN